MRNLKRALSLTLASVMLLGMMVMGSSALSFNDADDISNVTAASVLEDLGVMQGDGQGNFMPDQPVTRAQMAIIICRIMYGNRLNVDTLATEGRFTDVAPGAYYTGYINFAAQQGIIGGYGDGRFGPDDTVTTAQATLMLARGLGYYKAGEDQGDWASVSLNAIALGTKLGMFGDLRLGTNELLVRDNVCEMTFNTMTKANPVQYSEFFKSYYTDMDSPMSGVKFDYRETLGFKNYDLVYKTGLKTDEFGRPSTCWGVGRVTGTAQIDAKGDLLSAAVTLLDVNAAVVEPMDADLTYTKGVTGKDLARAVGTTPMDTGSGKYTWIIIENGFDISSKDSGTGYVVDTNNEPVSTDGDNDYGYTGKGVLTEIYVEPTDEDSGTVTVVYTKQYMGKVSQVGTDSTGRYINVILEKNGPAVKERKVYTDKFAVDDYVLVTVGKNDKGDSFIASAKAPETVEGKVTAYSNTTGSSYVDLDGKQYDIAYNTSYDLDNTGSVAFTDYRLYLDEYGYVKGYEQTGDTVSNYLYIDGTASSYVGDFHARAVFPDGTSKIILIRNNKGSISGSVTPNWAYRYELQDNGDYVLYNTTRVGTGSIGSKSAIVENGKARINNVAGEYQLTADKSTKFVHINDGGDYSAYVGYEKVPDIYRTNGVTKLNTTLWAVDHNGDTISDVIYVIGGSARNSNSVIFYIAANGNGDYKEFKEGSTSYFRYTQAYVDGQQQDIVVNEDIRAIIQDADNGVGAYKVLSTNDKGYVTALDEDWDQDEDSNGLVRKSEMVDVATAVTTSILLQTGKSYAYNNNTIFVHVDGKKVNPGTIGSIIRAGNSDATGVFVAKVDNNNPNLATLVYVVAQSNVVSSDTSVKDIKDAIANADDSITINNGTTALNGVTGAGKVTLGGSVPAVDNTTTAKIELAPGATVSGSTDLTGSAAATVNATTVASSGTLKLDNDTTVKGDITVATGGTLDLSHNPTFSAGTTIVLNGGTVKLSGSSSVLPPVSGTGTLDVGVTIPQTPGGANDITAGIRNGASVTVTSDKANTVTTVNAEGGISLKGNGMVSDYSSTQTIEQLAALTGGTEVAKIIEFTVPAAVGNTVKTLYYTGSADPSGWKDLDKDGSSGEASTKWTCPGADSGTGSSAGVTVAANHLENGNLTVGFYVSDAAKGIAINVNDGTDHYYYFQIDQ